MNEEAKKRLMLRFVLPLVIFLGLYYLVAVIYNQRGSIAEPRFWSMVKYAFVTYAGWLNIDLGRWMFALPMEWQTLGAEVLKVPAMQYVAVVDANTESWVYRVFPVYAVLSWIGAMVFLFMGRNGQVNIHAEKKLKNDDYVRGARLVSSKKLVEDSRKWVKDAICTLPTTAGDLLISDKRCRGHIFVMGATGTGKSQVLLNIIGGIKARNKGIKIIYADRKGEFFSKFGKVGKDILFNPFDRRTVHWSLFNEVNFPQRGTFDNIPADLQMMAKILFPTKGKRETLWDDAAARIFMSAMCWCFLNNKATMQDLYEFNNKPLKEIAAAFQTLPPGLRTGYSIIQDPTSKTAMSAMMNYTTTMQDLVCLNGIEGSWSVVDWINDPHDDSSLFLSSAGKNDAAFAKLITLLIDFCGREVHQFPDDGSHTTRVMFVFDELAALPRLSTLEYLLTQARSKGVSVVLATQSFEQVVETYGREAAHAIFANTKTKFVFAMPDPTDAEYLSKSYGTQEVYRREQGKNASSAGLFGKGDDRQGTNESRKLMQDTLFLPSQIERQATGQAIVSFPDFDGEIAQVQFLEADRYKTVNREFEDMEEEMISGRALSAIHKEKDPELEPVTDDGTDGFMDPDEDTLIY